MNEKYLQESWIEHIIPDIIDADDVRAGIPRIPHVNKGNNAKPIIPKSKKIKPLIITNIKVYEHRTLPYIIFHNTNYTTIMRTDIHTIMKIISDYVSSNKCFLTYLRSQLHKMNIHMSTININDLSRYLEVQLEGGTIINFNSDIYGYSDLSWEVLAEITMHDKTPINTHKEELKAISSAMKKIVYTINHNNFLLDDLIYKFIPTNNKTQTLKILKKEPEIRAFFDILYPKWDLLLKLKEKIHRETFYDSFTRKET